MLGEEFMESLSEGQHLFWRKGREVILAKNGGRRRGGETFRQTL